MERVKKQQVRRWCVLLLSLIISGIICTTGLAEDSRQPRVVRVAFPQARGLTETAEDGSRQGLVVDYLNEIAKYTGWEYEYIDTVGEEMVDRFLDGEFELMGGSYYMPGFEEYFAYPDYNTGYSKAVLLARRGDERIQSYNLESLNGKIIGVYDRASENIRRLREFLAINNLDCEIKAYSYEQLPGDVGLYPCLESGEIDLALGNSLEGSEACRVAVSFDSQPYYIVTNVGNQEILDGLNMALKKILDSNPDFGEECYKANFPDWMSADIELNSEELEYILQKGTATVAVIDKQHPLFCMNMVDSPHNGLIPNILEEITSYTGLEFSYVYAENFEEAAELVREGKADILGFFQGTEEEAAQQGLALTSSYVTMNNIIVRNKAVNYPDDGLLCAVVEGDQLPGDVLAAEIRKYSDITKALAAVNRGEADFICGLSAWLEYDIQRHHFSNLVPVTPVNDRTHISFALARPVNPNLLTILNKTINNLSAEEKNSILSRNMISIGSARFSVTEIIYANPVLSMTVLAVTLVVLAAVALWISHTHMQAAVMKSNLEKAEAQSKAKGEFLSRMSHEIRTPMNAVVGLSDLTCMMEGVPDNVKGNLEKIHSSSHYLLKLINDILDMSRIDSGMLSIANEPFSLKTMADEIQDMMETEAEQRGIEFIMEEKICHGSIVGDSIRLKQVLMNLLSNAFKFTPRGGTVILRIEEGDSSGKDAVFHFQVTDNGPGIPNEDRERIFESFEQLGSNHSKSQGTGLGLPISRNLVNMMGGELYLHSDEGGGSEFSFTVTLPLSETEAEPWKRVTPKVDHQLKGVRILLAEDNELNAEIAIQLLEIQGAAVNWCENGKTAVEQFEKSKLGEYQIILMDIQMPEMNGLEAARAIRALARPDASGVPIVAMTANTFQEDVNEAMEAGMNGFIPKPLDVNYLFTLLQDIVRDGNIKRG